MNGTIHCFVSFFLHIHWRRGFIFLSFQQSRIRTTCLSLLSSINVLLTKPVNQADHSPLTIGAPLHTHSVIHIFDDKIR